MTRQTKNRLLPHQVVTGFLFKGNLLKINDIRDRKRALPPRTFF
jgi:hypothetical protein